MFSSNSINVLAHITPNVYCLNNSCTNKGGDAAFSFNVRMSIRISVLTLSNTTLHLKTKEKFVRVMCVLRYPFLSEGSMGLQSLALWCTQSHSSSSSTLLCRLHFQPFKNICSVRITIKNQV